jgi:hypothetical protein
LNGRFTFNKIIELFCEFHQDKISQVIFGFDLMSVATREICDKLANLAATNSQ